MNIIELVRDALTNFPKIDKLVHIDFNNDTPDEFGLYPTGDAFLSEDILGNQKRKHTFVLYAVYQSYNDYDRMVNSGTLLELQKWLERYADNQIVSITVGETTLTGKLTKLTCANGMLYSVPDGNMNSGVQYQLQIAAEYSIESEEF